MNKKIILLSFFGLISYFTLSSNSNGNAANFTGVHGAANIGCGSAGTCHGTRNAGVSVAVWLEDSAGTAVYSYRPGKKCVLQMLTTHTTADNEPKYGFQLSTVTGSGISYTQAGSFDWATIPTGTGIDTVNDPWIFQQRMSLSPSTGIGGYGSLYKSRITWIAPPAGTGTVAVMAVSCVVDNNGQADTLADKWNNVITHIGEDSGLAVQESVMNKFTFSVWPMPVANELHIRCDDVIPGYYSLQVYTLAGVNVANIHVKGGDLNSTSINASEWATGMYTLVLRGEGVQKSLPFIKL